MAHIYKMARRNVRLPCKLVTLINNPEELSTEPICDKPDGHCTMLSAAIFFASLLALTYNLLCRRRLNAIKRSLKKHDDVTHANHIPTVHQQGDRLDQPHELMTAFTTLLIQDGAGTWPPKSSHSCWPTALRSYKDVYLHMVPYLSAATPSLDDAVNQKRLDMFRSGMRKLLGERVHQERVMRIMQQLEAGSVETLPQDKINGFYCTIAVCRHAYRYRFSSLGHSSAESANYSS